MSTRLQAILFKRKYYKSAAKALEWLKAHNFVPIKNAHKTAKYYRYRLIEPSKKRKYRKISLDKYIDAIVQI